MRKLLDRLLGARPDGRPRPLVATPSHTEVERQAIGILEDLFAAHPSRRPDRDQIRIRQESGLTIWWRARHQDFSTSRMRRLTLPTDGVLNEDGIARVRATAVGCLMEIARDEMLHDAGHRGPENEPGWSLLISTARRSMLASMDVRTEEFDALSVSRRIDRAVATRGGDGELRLEGWTLTGDLSTPFAFGRPSCSIDRDALRIRNFSPPETTLDAIVGRPLDDMLRLGPDGAPGVVVSHAASWEEGVVLTLEDPVVPLAPPPVEFAERWRLLTAAMAHLAAG